MSTLIQIREGTAADLAATNPQLAVNEWAVEIDTGKIKEGGGAFNSLSYSTLTLAGGTVADASETVKGKIEIATQAETNTGTDDARAVTPLKLANDTKWATKENSITAGTTAQYWRGDKTFQTLPTSLPPSGSAGGDLTGSYPNPTLVGTIAAATKGGADKTLTVVYDAKGRLTTVTENTIAISESQVTGLVADLAAKEPLLCYDEDWIVFSQESESDPTYVINCDKLRLTVSQFKRTDTGVYELIFTDDIIEEANLNLVGVEIHNCMAADGAAVRSMYACIKNGDTKTISIVSTDNAGSRTDDIKNCSLVIKIKR